MKKGFSFLSGRHMVALWFFGLFESIQMVAICNSQAMGESSENSDIDLFVITKRGQLWTARFVVMAISSILGVRRGNTHDLSKGSPEYIKKTKNKFCLSFFITEDAMNLDNIRIENDIYIDKWIESLIPLVNKNTALERFWKENKQAPVIHSSGFIRHSMIEKVIKKLWLPKTLRTYERLGKPWGVVISDTMLKFHDNDQRKIYRDSRVKE